MSPVCFQDPSTGKQSPVKSKNSLFERMTDGKEFSPSEGQRSPQESATRGLITDQTNQPNALIQPLSKRPSIHQTLTDSSARQSQTPPQTSDPSLVPIQPLLPIKQSNMAQADSNSAIENRDGQRVVPTKTTTETGSEFSWIPPQWLLDRLQGLESYSSTTSWATTVAATLQDLATVRSYVDPQCDVILKQLAILTDDAQNVIDRAVQRQELAAASQVLRIRYDLMKSQELWKQVIRLAHRNERRVTDDQSPFRIASFSRNSMSGLDPSWREYLMIDKLLSTLSDPTASDSHKRAQARATLARLTAPTLSDQQSAYLDHFVTAELVQQLRATAIEEVDLATLVESFDVYQEAKSGVHAAWIGREFQNLLWRPEPEANELATAIDSHLRNANVRISVSDRWLNRLLPPVQEADEPVSENVMGAQVFGQSRIANRLQFRFVPDNSRIQIILESVGRVVSSTEATKSGVTVSNQGNARFHALRRLWIGNRGIETDSTEARSNSNNQVVKIRSNMDGVPLLGPLVRRIAEKEIQAQQPATKQHVEQKLASTVKQRFEEETDAQLYQLQDYLVRNLIEPLTMLELEPVPIEMRSTEDRMIMRYRLAGRDQLAASTARPAGLDNSLLSMQVHESVINNLINRLELNGNEFTLISFREHLAQTLGVQPTSEDDSDEGDGIEANIKFAPYDPIRLSFEEDRILVEFNLKHLQIGKGKKWTNITASAKYRYEINGLKVTLEQDGEGVVLEGRNFNIRDQIAVRSIFTKIFRNDFTFSVLPQGIVDKVATPMHITQFDIIDGWIGISIDDQSPRVSSLGQLGN